MEQIASIVAAITGLITAIGVIITALLAYRARMAATEAKQIANDAKDAITEVGGNVYLLGKRVDGRLTELLKVNAAKASIEITAAHAQGVKDESDRNAEKRTG